MRRRNASWRCRAARVLGIAVLTSVATMPGLATDVQAAGLTTCRVHPSVARPAAQVRVTENFRPYGPTDWLTRVTSAGITGSASVRFKVAPAFGSSTVKVAVDVTRNGSSGHCATIFTPKRPITP
jgi:hypothetical protein